MKWVRYLLIGLSFTVGVALISLPPISRWWNNKFHVAAAHAYYSQASQLSQAEIDLHLSRAYKHNEFLYQIRQSHPNSLFLSYAAILPEDYKDILNVGGVMARLEIPVIGLDLPILHGTDPETMLNGVAHIEGTSFPIGGLNTHSAMTAHSGMHNVRLFSRLEHMDMGDVFIISVLDRRLVYVVDDIRVIEPHEILHLRIVPGEDMVTLITCTPIGINTHRLLVRGVRCTAYGVDVTGAE